VQSVPQTYTHTVYTQHSQNQEIKQKYFTTRQALHREKRGIKKQKENRKQKLAAKLQLQQKTWPQLGRGVAKKLSHKIATIWGQ